MQRNNTMQCNNTMQRSTQCSAATQSRLPTALRLPPKAAATQDEGNNRRVLPVAVAVSRPARDISAALPVADGC
eukprot:327763-Chlamydomonas_euryale.AAC.7